MIGASFGFTAHHLAPGDLSTGAQTQPTREVPGCGKACQVRTRLAEDCQGRGDIDSIDAR